MKPHMETLEFSAILQKLMELAVSDPAKQRLLALEPAMNEQVCVSRMMETTAARRVLDSFGRAAAAPDEQLGREPDPCRDRHDASNPRS